MLRVNLSRFEYIFLVCVALAALGLYGPGYLRENPGAAPFLANALYRDAGTAYELGLHYFGGGAYDLPRAKEFFAEALARDATYPWAHYQMGRVNFIEGNMTGAFNEFSRELALYPDHARAHYMRGLVLGYRGLFKEAAKDFKAFIEAKPEGWAAYNDLAWVYFQEGAYRKALDAAKRGLFYSPENPWLLNTAGMSAFNLGDTETAREYLEKARTVADTLTPADWGNAYPGNNPAIYDDGLAAMREEIRKNLALIPTAGDKR